jgi:3-dehydroquinate dehydratase type I
MYANVVGLITGPEIENCIHTDHSLCDILELRLDTFPTESWLDITQKLSLKLPDTPLLMTCRLKRDGGLWENSLSERRTELLEHLLLQTQKLNIRIDCLDFEVEEVEHLGNIKNILQAQNIEFLLSHHNFNASYNQAQLEEKHLKMLSLGADSTKFALMYTSGQDIIEAQNFVKSQPKNLKACFGMGELGQQSRLLHPIIGKNCAQWTYGFVGETPSAPGQISISEMHHFFKSLDF